MWAWIKTVPAVVKLLNTLSRWWDNYEIRKAERAKIKSELLEVEKEARKRADKIRRRYDTDPEYRKRVRDSFIRK